MLLKVGALHVAGRLPEGWIASALEAIRNHNPTRPIKRRAAYFLATLREIAAGGGQNLNRLLAQVRLPASLLARTTPPHDQGGTS
jgi:hypothetical protein